MMTSIIPKSIVISDSFNYTFNAMGSVCSIIILHYIAQLSMEKPLVIVLHLTSLMGIVYINYTYYKNFRSNHVVGNTLVESS